MSTTKEELSQYFHLPLKEVAVKLGICLSTLKKICRENGLAKWPYRKLCSLDKQLSSLNSQSEISNGDPHSSTELEERIRLLRKELIRLERLQLLTAQEQAKKMGGKKLKVSPTGSCSLSVPCKESEFTNGESPRLSSFQALPNPNPKFKGPMLPLPIPSPRTMYYYDSAAPPVTMESPSRFFIPSDVISPRSELCASTGSGQNNLTILAGRSPSSVSLPSLASPAGSIDLKTHRPPPLLLGPRSETSPKPAVVSCQPPASKEEEESEDGIPQHSPRRIPIKAEYGVSPNGSVPFMLNNS